MKVVEMWVDCHASNCSVLWVLHGQECQRCGRLDAPLPTPEITLGEEKKKKIHTAGGRTALWFESKEKKAADSAKKKKKTRLGTEQVRGFGRRHSSG